MTSSRLLPLLLFAALLFGVGSKALARGEVPWAEGGPSRGEDLAVTLLTFSPGDDIPSWFGHSALLVEDRRLHQALVYNYGSFQFGPDLLPKFLMGRLEFWLGEMSYADTVYAYRAAGRDIRAQELSLSPEKRAEVAAFLDWNARPENRGYLYDHYLDNCATRIRDVLDRAVGGQLSAATQGPGRLTLREHTRRHSQHSPYIDLVLMLWMNDQVDRPLSEWGEMFLPGELEAQLAKRTYTNEAGEEVPWVARQYVLSDDPTREPPPAAPNVVWPGALLLGLLLGGVAFGLGVWSRRRERVLPRVLFGLHNTIVGLLLGLPGFVLLLLQATEHRIAHDNENLLLTNPVLFFVAPLGIALAVGSTRVARWLRGAWYFLAATGLLALALKLVPGFDQENGMILALFLPVNLGFALAFRASSRVAPAQEARTALDGAGLDRA